MKPYLTRIVAALSCKMFYQLILACFMAILLSVSQGTAWGEPVYIDIDFELNGELYHLCIEFECGNGISACDCPCTVDDQITRGESSSPRSAMTAAPILLHTGGVVENPEDIRITSNSFTYTHKREHYNLNFFSLEGALHQGRGWSNALATQMLLEHPGDNDRLNLMLDASSLRIFTRRSTDTESPDYNWFDGPDDSYASIYHNTTDSRYEITNNESGEILYFEDLDGQDSSEHHLGNHPDAFSLTTRMNVYGKERILYFDTDGNPDNPYIQAVKIQHWDGADWVTDRQIDYLYTKVGAIDDHLKEIRVWASGDTTSTGHVVQWVRYTYGGEQFTVDGTDYPVHEDAGVSGFLGLVASHQLVMVENYAAGTGQTPKPDVSGDLNPADFAGNKVTMYRHKRSSGHYAGAFASIYDPEAVENMLASDALRTALSIGVDDSEHDALVKILGTPNDDGTLSDNDVLYYASRTFEYSDVSAAFPTTNIATTFAPAGEDLNALYGGEERDESTTIGEEGRVQSETVYTRRGGETKEYYYLQLNSGMVAPGFDVVRYLTIEDTVDADGVAVYRKVYGLNHQGVLLREVTIEDPTGTPVYWCTSYRVGTSGRGLNKPIEHRPPSAHTKVDTAEELRQFLDPTTGTHDADTLNGTNEGGRVYITDYDETAATYTVTTGVRDLSTGDTHWLGYQHYTLYGNTNKRFHLAAVYVEPGFGTTAKPTPDTISYNDAFYYFYFFYDAAMVNAPAGEQVRHRLVAAPVVAEGENGAGVRTLTGEYFDKSGRLRWTRDGEQNITYIAHDKVNGQRALVIQDIDTSNLPAEVASETDHWVAWSGGTTGLFATASDSRLSLTTITEYDDLARPRKVADAEGVDTFMAYQGNTTLLFPGWEAEAGTADRPDLPIVVTRTNDMGQVLESYTLRNSVAITGAGSDDPSNVENVDYDDYVSWGRNHYNRFNQLEHTDRFHTLPDGAAAPVEITHFYRDHAMYDGQGRVDVTATHVDGTAANTSATEQVNQRVYDVLHRVTEVKTTVSGTGHSLLDGNGDIDTAGLAFATLSRHFYDESIPGSGSAGVGDGLLTATQQFSDADDSGVYVETRYHRNGLAQLRGITRAGTDSGGSGESAEGPFIAVLPDNLGRTIGSAVFQDGDEPDWAEARPIWADRFRTDALGVAGRRALTRHRFDLRGQRYHTDVYSTQAADGVALGRVETDRYFDRNSQFVAGETTAGGAVEVAYDGARRAYQRRVLTTLAAGADKYNGDVYAYRAPVPVPGAPSGGTLPGSGGDQGVLSVSHVVLDGIGNTLQSIALEAGHNDTVQVGLDLSSQDDYVQTATHYFHDAVHRLTTQAVYGTSANGYTYAGLPAWDAGSIPASSDTVLVTDYSYDDASRLLEMTDPAGVVLRRGYDDLDRVVYRVANYVDFDFSAETSTGGGLGNHDDQVTKRVYNALDQVTHLIALDRDGSGGGGDHQTTAYTYGDSYLAHVLAEIKMPDSTGPADVVGLTYHLDGLVHTQTDQRGIEMTHGYDLIRRLQARAVTDFSGQADVDQTIQAITYQRDLMGLISRVTSHAVATTDPASQSDVRNEIAYTYHDHLGLSQEKQDHDSYVDAPGTADARAVSYAYDTADADADGVYDHGLRRAYTTYPHGRQVHTTYGAPGGIDDLISRVTGLADEHATLADTPGDALATYTWMGGGTLAKKVLDVPGVELDRVDSGGSGPAAGLEGLDRFGRVATQAWRDMSSEGGSGGGDRVHTVHGYDRVHRMLYADRLTNPGLSQAYTYDPLHRLDGFAIGVLERDLGGGVELDGVTGFASTDPLHTLIREDHDLDLLHNTVAIEDDATTEKVRQAVNGANELDDGTSGGGAGGGSGGGDRATDPTVGNQYANFSFSSTAHDDGFRPVLSAVAGDLSNPGTGTMTVSNGSAAAPRAFVADAEYGPAQPILRFKSSGTTGKAGLIFGYRDDSNYWLYTIDFSLTSGNAQLIKVVGGSATTVYAHTRNASGGWYQLYPRGIANMLDHFNPATDLSSHGGFPAGRWGVYSEASDAEFDYLRFTDGQVPRALSSHWSASGRNIVVDKDGNGDGQLLLSGAWDSQTLPTLLEGVRARGLRLTFKTRRASGQPYARAYLVLEHRGSGDYTMLSLLHGDGPGHNLDLTAFRVSGGITQAVDGDEQTVLGALDSDTVWYRVEYKPWQVTVYTLNQPDTPTEAQWSGATLAWQTTSWVGGGGRIGFLSGSYTMYVDDLTVETDHDLDGVWTTEHVETFELNASDQIEEDLEYDAAGNLTFDGVFRYTYDAFNRLVKAEKAYRNGSGGSGGSGGGELRVGSVVCTYAYDGQHRRIGRTVENGGTLSTDIGILVAPIDCYYAGDRLVAEYYDTALSFSEMLFKQYVWGPTYIDELVELKVLDTVGVSDTYRSYYALLDTRYCVLGLVDSSGQWAERYEYTPDGRRQVYLSAGSNDPEARTSTVEASRQHLTLFPGDIDIVIPRPHALCTIGFQGLMHDEVTGNICQRAREYSVRLGRFMQRDPLGYPDGMNTYAAYHVMYGGVDPTGLESGIVDQGGHVGLVVDIRDDDGNIVGYLTADFGMYGWRNGNSSSASFNRGGSCWSSPGSSWNFLRLANGRGEVVVEYFPNTEGGSPDRVAVGDEDKLIEFILDSAGLSQSDLDSKVESEECGIWEERGHNGWRFYRALSNNCSDYTISGLRALTKEDRYLGSFTPGGLLREWDMYYDRDGNEIPEEEPEDSPPSRLEAPGGLFTPLEHERPDPTRHLFAPGGLL